MRIKMSWNNRPNVTAAHLYTEFVRITFTNYAKTGLLCDLRVAIRFSKEEQCIDNGPRRQTCHKM